MRLTTLITVSTAIFWLWQFCAKKGTRVHIERYVYIVLSSIAVVVINTIKTPSGEFTRLLNNFFFEAHIFLGALYFLGLIGVATLGIKTREDAGWKKLHAGCVQATFIALILSLMFAALIPLGK